MKINIFTMRSGSSYETKSSGNYSGNYNCDKVEREKNQQIKTI